MKVLALNSSPLKARGNTEVILNEFIQGLQEAGAEVEKVYIGDLEIKPCLGKLACWVKTPGKCCQEDDMASLLDKLKDTDVWVLASPIYWDGVTGPMKNFFDRMLPLLEPFIELRDGHCRHPLRDDVNTGKIVVISSCGFWELDNFQQMIDHIKAVCKNIQREFAGALVRPHGALLKYKVKNDKDNETIGEILKAARAAGHEMVNDGKISKDTMAVVSREFITRDEYIKILNKNFEGLIEKNMGR